MSYKLTRNKIILNDRQSHSIKRAFSTAIQYGIKEQFKVELKYSEFQFDQILVELFYDGHLQHSVIVGKRGGITLA